VTRWLQGLFGTVLACLVLGLVLAAPASAHTVLVGSDPADGTRLAASPASVTLRFNEQVGLQPGYLRVVDSAGRRVDTGSVTHPGGDGSRVAVTLRSGLRDGTYLVSFRVISADSHPVAGSVRYVVGDGPLEAVGGGAGSASAPVDRLVSTGLALSHWLSFAGVAMVGGSWLVFTLWPAGSRRRSIRRLVWSGWSLAALGAVTEYLLEGPYAAGTGLSTVTDRGLLDGSLHGNAGQLLSLRVLLLGVLGMVLVSLFDEDVRRRPSGAPEAAAVVGAGVVVTFAASGHTQSTSPRWLWVLVSALHLSAMIVWMGGLVVLLVAAFSRAGSAAQGAEDAAELDAADAAELDAAELDRAQLAAGLPTFSRVAMACVLTLAVTGTLQAWREVGALDAITTTRYGQLVLLKVALFVGLVGLGYFSRGAVLRMLPARSAAASAALPVTAPATGTAPVTATAPATGTATAMTSTGTAPAGPATATLPPPRSGAGRPSRTGLPSELGRTVLSEVVIGALVLAATGVLIFQPPGKVALAAERSKPRHATVQVSATTQAAVDVTPGVHGNVRITVRLTGGPRAVGITATASLPAQKLGPIPVRLQAAGPGSYTSTEVLLPAAGLWELSLTVRTSEFDSTVAVARIRIS
jgi:copper transport protein